ncbi:cell division protein ZapE [Acinetobacter seifertii]|uniref:cell division protein ZapE n=1 Tax=Acinetobacter seifertii TaxID=1530123 RepID=UPI002ADFC925|nr:cell division protein ZapE [Acinetobacter seifertii]
MKMLKHEGQSPLEIYNSMIDNGVVLADPSQRQAIETLNEIWNKIENQSSHFFSPQIKGLYMWGSVGTGKTWIMDLFYNSLNFKKKMRVHFHHFLKDVHKQLIAYRGNKDPLKLIANDIASNYKLICFDEFFVSNVADAMILSNLFNLLFSKKVILVATSNIDPEDLYKDGLNRDRFLETIDHINKNCTVLKIGNQLDYRTIKESNANDHFYRFPLNEESEQWLHSVYQQLTHNQKELKTSIMINHRSVEVKSCYKNVIWFDFENLCREARSPADYIEIATQYDYVLISGIGDLTDRIYDTVRRFIYLIDELYDQKIKLYFAASQPLNQLYKDERLKFEFQRTYSRLQEMQSISYNKELQEPA